MNSAMSLEGRRDKWKYSATSSVHPSGVHPTMSTESRMASSSGSIQSPTVPYSLSRTLSSGSSTGESRVGPFSSRVGPFSSRVGPFTLFSGESNDEFHNAYNHGIVSHHLFNLPQSARPSKTKSNWRSHFGVRDGRTGYYNVKKMYNRQLRESRDDPDRQKQLRAYWRSFRQSRPKQVLDRRIAENVARPITESTDPVARELILKDRRRKLKDQYRARSLRDVIRMPVTHEIIQQKLERREEGIGRLKQRLDRDKRISVEDKANVERRIAKAEMRTKLHQEELYRIERQKVLRILPSVYQALDTFLFETRGVSLCTYLQDYIIENQVDIIASVLKYKQDTVLGTLVPLVSALATRAGVVCAPRVPGLGITVVSLISLANTLGITQASTDKFLRRNWDALAQEVGRALSKVGIPLRNLTVRGYVMLARISQIAKKLQVASSCVSRSILLALSMYFHNQLEYYSGYDLPVDAIVEVLSRPTSERILAGFLRGENVSLLPLFLEFVKPRIDRRGKRHVIIPDTDLSRLYAKLTSILKL